MRYNDWQRPALRNERFPPGARTRHALPVWWFPAIDAAGVGPAEVAAQPVHRVVVGETAAEVRDNGLDALGEAPGVDRKSVV